MSMDIKKLKDLIIERLDDKKFEFHFDKKNNQLRIELSGTKKGVNVSLPPILSKWEEKKEKALDEVIYFVTESLEAMKSSQSLIGKEKDIFPVIRSASFPTKTKEGISLLTDEHTAETRIFYALDLGNTYRLIDEPLFKESGWSENKVKEVALFNIRSLKTTYKEDVVAGNKFYFVNTKDGYDASRVLNEKFLENMEQNIKGTMAVLVPHQDVLVIADIKNDQGYDILGQLGMSFFTDGVIPITALPFLYENKVLEPIFVMTQKKK